MIQRELRENNIPTAIELYEKNRHRIVLPDEDLELIINYYFDRYSALEAVYKYELTTRNFAKALDISQERINISKKLTCIHNSHYHLLLFSIKTHAEFLLVKDRIEHPDVRESDRAQLMHAYNELAQFHLLSKSLVVEASNNLLLRIIECFIARLEVPISAERLNERYAPTLTTHNELNELKMYLKSYIDLNPSVKSPNESAKLSRVYCLFAHTILYFESQKDEALLLFQQASDLMPTNLHYTDCYSRLTGLGSAVEENEMNQYMPGKR